MNYSRFVHWVESFLPLSIIERHRERKQQRLSKKQDSNYRKIVCRIQHGKRPVKVLFFALDSNTWKYDSLFQEMQIDSCFEPLIIVVPQVNKGKDFMLYQLKHGYDYYLSCGYSVLSSYDEKKDQYLDVHLLNPDVIFFSNPYDSLVDDRYNIRHYCSKALTCYVNYAFCTVPDSWACASPFHQKVWRYYVECDNNLAQIKMYYAGKNCVVTGYPSSDLFASTVARGKDWKLNNHNYKRIIWAPHHTIEGETGLIQFSTFLLYCDFMLQVADEYRDSLQFVFKPHPIAVH